MRRLSSAAARRIAAQASAPSPASGGAGRASLFRSLAQPGSAHTSSSSSTSSWSMPCAARTSSSAPSSPPPSVAPAEAAAAPQPPPAPEPLVSASRRKELYMVFTCGRCNTRAVKGFSKQAYEQGVVLVDCPGCNARHLVADRMGWFGEKGDVASFLAERGEEVVLQGGEDALELTAEELACWRGARGGETAG